MGIYCASCHGLDMFCGNCGGYQSRACHTNNEGDDSRGASETRWLLSRSDRLASFEAYGLIQVVQWLDKCNDVTKLQEERDNLRAMNTANEVIIAELHRKIGKWEHAFDPYHVGFEPETVERVEVQVEWKAPITYRAPEVDFERAWRLKYGPEGPPEDLCQSCKHEQDCCLWARKCDIVSKCLRYDLFTWPPR
jgi:hypothetical protein